MHERKIQKKNSLKMYQLVCVNNEYIKNKNKIKIKKKK